MRLSAVVTKTSVSKLLTGKLVVEIEELAIVHLFKQVLHLLVLLAAVQLLQDPYRLF